MAHPTRGHRSAAYEILKLVDVNPDKLSITVLHAGAFEPQTHTIDAVNNAAARQMLTAMAASIKVSPTADRYSGWESVVTLRNAVWFAGALLEQAGRAGVDDGSAARIGDI